MTKYVWSVIRLGGTIVQLVTNRKHLLFYVFQYWTKKETNWFYYSLFDLRVLK